MLFQLFRRTDNLLNLFFSYLPDIYFFAIFFLVFFLQPSFALFVVNMQHSDIRMKIIAEDDQAAGCTGTLAIWRYTVKIKTW